MQARRAAEGDEAADEQAGEVVDKTNDPVRMYLREMGTVALLTRDGEIDLAQRIEHGQRLVLRTLSRSPLVIRESIRIAAEAEEDTLNLREVLAGPDLLTSDEEMAALRVKYLQEMEDIGNATGSCSCSASSCSAAHHEAEARGRPLAAGARLVRLSSNSARWTSTRDVAPSGKSTFGRRGVRGSARNRQDSAAARRTFGQGRRRARPEKESRTLNQRLLDLEQTCATRRIRRSLTRVDPANAEATDPKQLIGPICGWWSPCQAVHNRKPGLWTDPEGNID